mmetsp:Transcript_31625/g.46671  ORF Transcript_31625/g.46671 Transcript_31625/m.46671 type:complete len:475 (-) Transcript_31625:571-1995(-)|eukprot:CAMPEP_0194229232 /NCGR_PEP_ID=MMETSP0156-20130528/43785_1 /TAXON_ID=33649 /ORGANISM="Thalassionema nitzschioides, Strain L26-B" /LENGTH=474 /DNA_ID=CAMNT_0038961775 /DNA_START=23 /DNA_END=1447 /DNA_ORIENTATION=+
MACPSTKEEDSIGKEEDFSHEIEIGDHLIRWTSVALWPVQIHAICLESEVDSITLIDFGLTSSKKQQQEGKTCSDRNVMREIPNSPPQDDNHDRESLLALVEKYKNEMVGPKRIEIVIIRTEKELKRWHKVEYGKKLGCGFWKFFQKGAKDNEEDAEEESELKASKKDGKVVTWKDEKKLANKENGSQKAFLWALFQSSEKVESDGETTAEISKEYKYPLVENGERPVDNNKPTNDNDRWKWWSKSTTKISSATSRNMLQSQEAIEVETGNNQIQQRRLAGEEETLCNGEIDGNDNVEKLPPSPLKERSIPKSDPTTIVLARVRYLLSNPDVLPPHNIFHANSECLAVWCKTGRWSTIQASVFLHTTAAGNLKSAISVSAMAASATVTTTTPMWGPLGWAGLNTSSTVGLLSIHPWLIPVLAGYGAIAVGAPYVLLAKAKKRWDTTTQKLTDGFWEWADPDVYVEAIQSWSAAS